MSSVLPPWKRRFIWAEKSVFTAKKGVHFGLKSECFIVKKGVVLSWKASVLQNKGGHFQTGEQGWVPLFSVSEGAGVSDGSINTGSLYHCTL